MEVWFSCQTELSVTCGILPSSSYIIFPLRKQDLVIPVLYASQLAESSFLQRFMARHLKPELLFLQVYRALDELVFSYRVFGLLKIMGIGYRCSEMLQDLLDIFFLRRSNLLNLEEDSAV